MRFSSIGFALPTRRVTNDDVIEEVVSRSRESLPADQLARVPKALTELFALARTEVRYLRAPNELARDLGIMAAESALKKAGMSSSDIDLLIYVGVGRGFLEPATANVFQDALRMNNATCFDVLDACASWIRAVDIARCFIEAKVYRNVMILNSECSFKEYSDLVLRSLDELEYKFAILTTGEAATATILTTSDRDDQWYASFRTWGGQNKLCQVPLPHHAEFANDQLRSNIPPLRFFSYSQRLFRTIFTKLVQHYRNEQHFTQFKHDIMFGHAASDSMTKHVVESLDINNAYFSHARFGNTVSASVPLAMAHAIEEGQLTKDMNVLLGVGSAGLTTAWCGVRYF